MKKISKFGVLFASSLALGIGLLTPIGESLGLESRAVQAQTEAVTITIDYVTRDYSANSNPGGVVKEIHASETVTIRPGETIRLEPKQVEGYVTPSPKDINYNSYVYLFKKYGATVDNVRFYYEKKVDVPIYNYTVEEAQAYVDSWITLQQTLKSINTHDFSLYTDESINKSYTAGGFSGTISTTIDIRRDILTNMHPPTVEEVRQYSSFPGLAWAKIGMESDLSILQQALSGLVKKAPVTQPTSSKNIYRLYDRTTNQHFYTSNNQEVSLLQSRGWRLEGTAWKVSSAKQGTAVYRVWNTKTGERIFTRHKTEVDRLASRGWKNEGIAFYTQTSGQPIYRLRNKHTGRYLLTVGQTEVAKLVATGQWQNEGTAFYGVQ